MTQRAPLVIGSDGLLQQLQAADALATGLRVETYTTTAADASGNASIAFSPAFQSPPTVIPLVNVSGTTVTVGKAGAPTKTGCSFSLTTSRGTLVLSSGPFAVTPGATIPVVVIGA